MNPGRRTLQYASLDDIMPDVERLLSGCSMAGTWSLAQICRHLATVTRRVVDLPASTPSDPSKWVPEEKKRQVFESGRLPEGLPGIPELAPPAGLDPREEAEGLRSAIAHYRASESGPAVPHRFFGPLSKEEWDRLTLIHCAHHLSFATPQD